MIGLYNVTNDLQDALALEFEICDFDDQPFDLENCPDLGGLFVDWLPQNLDENLFIKQAAILQEYVKRGIPVALFDRHSTIDQKQYRWLSNYNVTFMEPRVRFRTGFEWCPHWTKPLPDDWWSSDVEDSRKHSLAYLGPLATQIKSFEKYYQTYASLFPEAAVVYKCTDLDLWKGHSQLDKLKGWQERNLIPQNTIKDHFKWEDVDTTVLIGSHQDYATGYLPENLFTLMNLGVIPLLPIEHRFFGTIFDNLIVRDERDLDYAIKGFPKVRQVIIEEIFYNILKHFPEFKIEYMVNRLKECMQ